MAAPSTLTVNTEGTSVEFISTNDVAWGSVTTDTAQTLSILVDDGGANERTLVVDLNDPTTAIAVTGGGFTIATVSYRITGHRGIASGEAVEIVSATAGILDDTVVESDAISAATAVTNNSTITYPVINLTKNQATTTQPYQPVSVTCGMARVLSLLAVEWTQVGATTEYYYNLDPALLSSNTLQNVRAKMFNSTPKSVYSRAGTIDSLPTFGYAFGDDDSIGFNTLYVNSPSGIAPVDYEVAIMWDESLTGEEGFETADGSTVEWWLDQTDGPTATAVAGWATEYQHTIDHRDGSVLDMAGVAPTATTGSPIRGWCYSALLPEGTLKLKCRVTNSAGLQTTASQTVTVAASTRTLKTVKASGGDYTTLLAAVNAASADWEITVEGGHTESTSGQILVNDDGTFVRWDGVGDPPEISMSSKGFNINQADFTTIYGLKLIATSSGTTYGVSCFKSKYNGVVGCEFTSDGVSGANTFDEAVIPQHTNALRTDATEGTFVQGNTCDKSTAYVISGNDNRQISVHDMVVVGNDFGPATGPSTNESTIRDVAEFGSPVYMYNKLSEDSKDALRQTHTSHSTAYGNSFVNGTLRVGNSSASLSHHKAIAIRIDSNRVQRSSITSDAADLGHHAGCAGETLVNNVVVTSHTKPAISGASAPGVKTDVHLGYDEHTDMTWAGNSIEIEAGFGTTGTVIGGSGVTTSTYVINQTIIGNAIYYHSTYVGTPIVEEAATSSDNQATEDTMDADFFPAAEPDTISTPIGAYYDYWGNVRGATSYKGAVSARADGSAFASAASPVSPSSGRRYSFFYNKRRR